MSDPEHQLRQFVCGALEQNRRWRTAYFLSTTGDFDLAQDLVQETFVRAVHAAPRSDTTQGTLGAWLRGIARHVRSEHCRRTSRDPLALDAQMIAHLDLRAARTELDDADPDDREHRLHLLHQCLEKLTSHVRRIFQMKYQQRTRSAQIAVALGMKENAVNVALHRGRRILQECIEQHVGQELSHE